MTLRHRGYLGESGMLLATGATLAGIKKAITKFYAGSKVTLTPVSEKEWTVSTGKGVCKTVHVVKKGKRYRFEAR